MEQTKQVIVVRKDLKMSHGKMAAQVAHASLGAVLAQGEVKEKFDKDGVLSVRYLHTELMHNPALNAWLYEQPFVKTVLAVKSEQELLDLWNQFEDIQIGKSLIKDSGRTVFTEPTYTCFAIGPAVASWIDTKTGHLPLY